MLKLSNLLFILLTFTISGCMEHRGWVYNAEPKVYMKNHSNIDVVVLPLVDKRNNFNKDYIAVGMIPLVPYGWLESETPETIPQTIGIQNWEPSEQIAKATAQELNNANIFSNVFFGYKENEGDFFIIGELESTKVNAKLFFYGLTPIGDLLWLVGFPAGTYDNELKITFKLMDKKYKEHFSKTYVAKMGEVRWIYEGALPLFNFDTLLKEILLEFKEDMRAIEPNLK